MPLPKLSDPKGLGVNFIAILKGCFSFVVLMPLLIFINFLQTLSLVVKPFSGFVFRRINRFFANFWWGFADIMAVWYGLVIQHTGDDPPEEENAILIVNHQELTDIPVLFRFARAKGRVGDFKWFLKDILKYIPGIGWGMLFLDCFFLKRDWMKDKNSIKNVFAALHKYSRPFWVISFVEGTRIRPKKLAQSQEFASQRNLYVPKHTLVPRTKGFIAAMEGLRERADAIYDITIAYEEGVPSMWQWYKGYSKGVHVHIKRFSAKDLPMDEAGLSEWLYGRFEEKDKKLDAFYKEGMFN